MNEYNGLNEFVVKTTCENQIIIVLRNMSKQLEIKTIIIIILRILNIGINVLYYNECFFFCLFFCVCK